MMTTKPQWLNITRVYFLLCYMPNEDSQELNFYTCAYGPRLVEAQSSCIWPGRAHGSCWWGRERRGPEHLSNVSAVKGHILFPFTAYLPEHMAPCNCRKLKTVVECEAMRRKFLFHIIRSHCLARGAGLSQDMPPALRIASGLHN